MDSKDETKRKSHGCKKCSSDPTPVKNRNRAPFTKVIASKNEWSCDTVDN